MVTIAETVHEILEASPYLEDLLVNGLINISSLARSLKPEIERRTMKHVTDSAVIMALNRIVPQLKKRVEPVSLAAMIGDLTVRSHLSEYTFANSATLSARQLQFFDYVKDQPDTFYSQSQGVAETTIIVSAVLEEKLLEVFSQEQLKTSFRHMSSITVRLTQDTTDTPGIYYALIKPLSWEGINIIELNSTNLELTFFFSQDQVNRAFQILNGMITKGSRF